MIASGLTRRSLCAAIESSVPSPHGGLRMPPGYHDANQLGRTNRPNLHGGRHSGQSHEEAVPGD